MTYSMTRKRMCLVGVIDETIDLEFINEGDSIDVRLKHVYNQFECWLTPIIYLFFYNHKLLIFIVLLSIFVYGLDVFDSEKI